MRRSIVFATDALEPLMAVARTAEEQGFHRLWTTEYTARDAVLRAVAIAQATERIRVASGITYAFTRAPLAMAAAAADAYAITRGRFALGMGAGTRGMRTRWFGVHDFDHPAPRFAEYVQLLKAAWSSEGGLDFDGRFYQARIPAFRPSHDPAFLGGLAVYGSGLNRIMLREAAASCDGVALHPLASARHYLDAEVVPAIAAGAERAGDKPPALAIWQITSIHEDEDVARERARKNLAFYYSTPSYASTSAGTAWEGAVTDIRDAFREQGSSIDWSALAALVTDEMIDALVLCGTPRQVQARLPTLEADLASRGADEIVFQTVGVGLDDTEVVGNCQLIAEVCGATHA